jgi:hypothetical protein
MARLPQQRVGGNDQIDTLVTIKLDAAIVGSESPVHQKAEPMVVIPRWARRGRDVKF